MTLLERAVCRSVGASSHMSWDDGEPIEAVTFWATVADAVEQLRTAGVAGSGLRVALQLPTSLQTAVLHFAIMAAGSCVQPVTVSSGPGDVTAIMAAAPPDVFIGLDERNRAAAGSCSSGAIRVLDPADLGSAVLRRGDEASRVSRLLRQVSELDDRAPALVLSTSGSTGAPKLVVHSQRTMAAAVDVTTDAMGMHPDDVFFCGAPPTHVTGLLFGFYMPAMTGTSCAFLSRWDAEAAARVVDRHRCTVASGVPTFLLDLYAAHQRVGGHFLQRYCTGGAMVPTEQVTEVERATGCCVMRGYGSSEIPMATCAPWNGSTHLRLELDGIVHPTVEVVVEDPDEAGVGEMLLSGPQMALGQLRLDGSVEPFPDGRFRTGDLGKIVEGSVKVVGRVKDIVIRGGVKFFLPELDALVAGAPGVAEAACFVVPDPRLGELPAAAVVVQPGRKIPTVDDLLAHFSSAGVAAQKCPVLVMEVSAIPRTESNKVDRPALTREAAAR